MAFLKGLSASVAPCSDALYCHVSRDTGLRVLVGNACARELIRRRLLPGVCSTASVRVARKGQLDICRDLLITLFLSYFWGLATMKKLNTEPKFCIVTFIFSVSNEAILMTTHNIPSCCRKSKRSLFCLFTWRYYQPSLARTTPVSN